MTNQGPVLVVDDDNDIREMAYLVLTEEGYEVHTAEHGAAALQHIRRERFGLILFDLNMPVMDGKVFATVYRSLFRFQAPLVVMSAAMDACSWAEQARADGYLAKPFNFDILIDTVHQLTDSHRPAT
jgi:two-component system, chemotaxis family, chemotaxis protein CheY